LPEVRTWLNGTPRAAACASANPSAPDWLMSPIALSRTSGGGMIGMKVMRALRMQFRTPMQFGPINGTRAP
jgi:hypothetical protein